MPRVDAGLIPTGLLDLDAQWLGEVVGEEAGSQLRLTQIAVTSFSRVVEVTNGRERWVVKWSRTDRRHPELERGHEVLFYEKVAPSLPPDTLAPAIAWAYSDERTSALIVFRSVANVTPQRPSHLPPLREVTEMMVDTLASIHAARWSDPPFDVAGTSLVDHEEIDARASATEDRVSRLLTSHSHALGPEISQILNRIVEQMPRILKRLQDSEAMTVVHDDVHIGNFLIPNHSGQARLLDWQTWTTDLAAKDLAHMIAYFWFPSPRKTLEEHLLRRYHGQLASHGIDYGQDELWHDYRLCVIRKVLHAVWEWDLGVDEWKWYSHLARAALAYRDLSCADF